MLELVLQLLLLLGLSLLLLLLLIIIAIIIIIVFDVFQAGKLDVYFETEEKIMSKATLVSCALS